jgi:predicted branched-subunit amino acid permease
MSRHKRVVGGPCAVTVGSASDRVVTTMSPLRSFNAGAVALAPVLLGVVPFGLVAGFAATEAGLGMSEAVGFSVLMFAGAAQLAALDLLGSGAPAWVAILTAGMVNLRLVMYSAALAPYLAREPLQRRLLGSYLLTDQAFVASVAQYQRTPQRTDRWWFYLGAATSLWLPWQVATVLGVLLGDAVPSAVPLAFAVPLSFIALLAPNIADKPALLAACTAAVVATLATPLPANLGMPAGAVAGVLVGWIVARRKSRR